MTTATLNKFGTCSKQCKTDYLHFVHRKATIFPFLHDLTISLCIDLVTRPCIRSYIQNFCEKYIVSWKCFILSKHYLSVDHQSSPRNGHKSGTNSPAQCLFVCESNKMPSKAKQGPVKPREPQ